MNVAMSSGVKNCAYFFLCSRETVFMYFCSGVIIKAQFQKVIQNFLHQEKPLLH